LPESKTYKLSDFLSTVTPVGLTNYPTINVAEVRRDNAVKRGWLVLYPQLKDVKPIRILGF
jgi:hypothetical protein